MKRMSWVVLLLTAMFSGVLARAQAPDAKITDANVTRAKLDNGMRVVIVHNPLAPVVTVEANYLVGGDETYEPRCEDHFVLPGRPTRGWEESSLQGRIFSGTPDEE